jgi:hypothetical protein
MKFYPIPKNGKFMTKLETQGKVMQQASINLMTMSIFRIFLINSLGSKVSQVGDFSKCLKKCLED